MSKYCCDTFDNLTGRCFSFDNTEGWSAVFYIKGSMAERKFQYCPFCGRTPMPTAEDTRKQLPDLLED